MKIIKSSYLLAVSLTCFSLTTFANDESKCDINQFFDQSASVQLINSDTGNRVAFDTFQTKINWTAVENMFDINSNSMELKNLKNLKDPNEIVKLWYEVFRYNVIEDYLLHKTKLLKHIDLGSGGKVQIIDATFEGKSMRYSLYATTDYRNVYFYYVNALASENKLLPDADQMFFVLKSMVNSCQEDKLRIIN